LGSSDEDTTVNRGIRDRFRGYVADELRYKRFLLQMADSAELMWWQERLWEQFTRAEGISVPASHAALVPIFAGALAEVMPRNELHEKDVPAWCTISSLGGQSPVQGWGTCIGHDWYFRARWGDWELVVYEKDGVGALVRNARARERTTLFQRDDGYGDERYDASYMPIPEARYFIVEALREFMESQNGPSG
jgi:hypothetical protein